jgi:hypothetical protein
MKLNESCFALMDSTTIIPPTTLQRYNATTLFSNLKEEEGSF